MEYIMATKKQIKDTNVIKTPEIVIQPPFALPKDVVDVRPATEEEVQYNPTGEVASAGLSPEQGGAIPSATTPDTTVTSSGAGKNAATLTIVSQKSRQTADGTTVVDVIIDIEGGVGSTYE